MSALFEYGKLSLHDQDITRHIDKEQEMNCVDGCVNQCPSVKEHAGVFVVRDDLHPGGTKARFFVPLFSDFDECVYASPAEGGAQTALAFAARQTGKRATIFVARRKAPHPRTLLARQLGANVVEVRPGHLSVVKARAKAYASTVGAYLVPFGADVPGAIDVIASTAKAIDIDPDEVWCAAGSGVLSRSLAKAWPSAKRHAVQIGRTICARDVGGATIHRHPARFGQRCASRPPFPSDPHYDAKAWEYCRQFKGKGTVLFWNVTGPADA